MTTPTITGKPQVGQTLAASIGDINPPVAYQWNSAGKPVSGATSAAYVPSAADVGNIITVTVKTVSPATAAVINIIPTNTAVPTISGIAQQGQTLTASPGAWTHNPTSYIYQWANTSVGLIKGATSPTYVPTASDVGFRLAVFVVAVNSGGGSAVAESALTGAVLPAIPVNTALPTIGGTAQVGQTLSASTGTWTNSPTSFAYQWSDSASGPIGGATTNAYVPTSANLGHTLTVSVVATNAVGPSTPATSAATSAVTAASIPVIVSAPTIGGTAQVGQTLSASTGTWTNSPTSYAYQWNDGNFGPIAGATMNTYVPTSANLGHVLVVFVTAINAAGSSEAIISAPTSAVTAASIPVIVSGPTIGGTAQVGQTLSASTGTWTNSPTSFAYQWSDSASGPIGGATTNAYVPTSANLGHTLTVSVVATNAVGPSTPATSAATSAVTAASIPVIVSAPTIGGTAQVGQTLSASTGTWTNSPTSYAYQWNDGNFGPIAGATMNTYVPTSANLGHVLVVFVTAINAAGSSEAIISAPTSAVTAASIPVIVSGPTIGGTAQVGQTLSASTGTWTNSPTSFAYQWADSATGSIAGATMNTYVPTSANLGHTLTVSVVATNAVGPSTPATSAATSAVTAASIPVIVSAPTIGGTAQVGQTLSASTGTWTNSPTSFAYQWADSATGSIAGATTNAYVPTSANLGHTLTVSVVATNAVGPSTPATSAATSAVTAAASIPVIVSGPTIGGTAQVGQTLSASTGTWTNSPTSFAYQWSDSATGSIAGATTNAYVPTSANLGHTLTVSVVATNAVGPSTPATSAATSAVTAGSGGVLDFSQASNSGLITAIAA